LLILSLLIGSFAYDMHIEAGITSYYRKRMKAQYLARAGMEWAKLILYKSYEVSEQDADEAEEGDTLVVGAYNLSRGVGVSGRVFELGDGKFTVDILPEQGRYNVNTIDDDQWVELLDYSGVPQEKWDELLDCFHDWVDDNDLHLLNGAESDDAFYRERGYKVKNGPLDTINELLLIKGFTDSVVYGGPSEDDPEEVYSGIAGNLTTWGDGKVNINTAPFDVIMTLPGIPDDQIAEAILEQRKGEDGELGTKDDGFESVQEVLDIPGVGQEIGDRITTTERRYVRVVSMGEVQGIKSGIWCVLVGDQGNVVPVFWREESMQ